MSEYVFLSTSTDPVDAETMPLLQPNVSVYVPTFDDIHGVKK